LSFRSRFGRRKEHEALPGHAEEYTRFTCHWASMAWISKYELTIGFYMCFILPIPSMPQSVNLNFVGSAAQLVGGGTALCAEPAQGSFWLLLGIARVSDRLAAGS
jgi:hypothetical protein